MVEFTIYYGDGSEYEGPPENAPVYDVQAITWIEGGQTVCLHGQNLYFYSDDLGWIGNSRPKEGLVKHLLKRPCVIRAVIKGKWMSEDKFIELLTRVVGA